MTPQQFLASLEKQSPRAVYLFAGQDNYRRQICRKALIERALPEDQRESGYIRHDLERLSLQEVIDDARSMSLFAGERLIWVGGAEQALPRGRASSGSEEGEGKDAGAEALKAYCEDPTPGTVVVFDSQRIDFDGDDKPKMERLLKFFAPVGATVEFTKLDMQEARGFAGRLAAERKMRLNPKALEELVEVTAGDAARIASEIEKLSLYLGPEGGTVTSDQIRALTPNAAETTIFALVDAVASRDREDAMELLDRLVREGEYLPLALTFLGGIFRLALTAKEANLRSAKDVMNHFRGLGIPMWFSRAEQIHSASQKFSRQQLGEAIELVFQTDRALKSTRPDDRIVVEDFVFRLTARGGE